MAFTFELRQFKGGFFDSESVLAEMSKVERKTLSKFGAFTRRRMKSSLKYKDGKSAAGNPPHAHKTKGFTRPKRDRKTGQTKRQAVSPLRELIYFAYDPATHSVVVGPVKFGGRGGVAPGLLERGGGGQFRTATGEFKRGVWAPRPFVKPAGEAEVKAGKYLTP